MVRDLWYLGVLETMGRATRWQLLVKRSEERGKWRLSGSFTGFRMTAGTDTGFRMTAGTDTWFRMTAGTANDKDENAATNKAG
jgi:hypothetical protein